MNRPNNVRRAVVAAAATAATLIALPGCGSDTAARDPAVDAAPAADPTRAPEIASWATVGGIAVPLGAVDGPTSDPGRPFTGFTHTPQGAALAAISQSVQLSVATDGQWSTILPAVTAPGPGRDAYAAHRALVSVSGTDPAVVPDIVGYRITDYTDTAADVSVVQRFPDDSLAASRTAVVFTGGDWKLDLPTGGGTAVTALDAEPAEMVALDRPGR
ncbi:hypothetical protein HQ602_17495 [Rhodococcus kroppenstedtii]|uniref:hypothetical protein n=1 Tax=Rhodococcoides kroppenstedtii TaxID=293050 RepID=UPI001C9B8AD1|nr:hypothetical protein [Rhodococcus kroppenstedtii]MBY6438170.1 hypothetical protein [Rhodococcus kroppenstedtii]